MPTSSPSPNNGWSRSGRRSPSPRCPRSRTGTKSPNCSAKCNPSSRHPAQFPRRPIPTPADPPRHNLRNCTVDHIRLLRPQYQCPVDPDAPSPEEAPSLPGTDVPPSSPSKIKNQQSPIINPSPTAWPKGTTAQFSAVTHLLPTTGPDAEAISASFGRKSKTRVREIEEILETLKSLGKLE